MRVGRDRLSRAARGSLLDLLLFALALAVLGGCGPTTDEAHGVLQRQAIAPELRDAWAADLDRFAGARDLWDRTRDDGPFEPAGRYLFGKFGYRLDFFRRGEEITLLSWGIDYSSEQDGPWLAIGSGQRVGDEAVMVWSCLNLALSSSHGGGARIVFSEDDELVRVEYHHDADPLHVEYGTGVRIDAEGRRVRPIELLDREVLFSSSRRRPGVLTIRGLVTAAGQPLPGAAVHVRGESRPRAVSDRGGVFEFQLGGVTENILLACSASGHQNGETWVRPDAPVARFDLRPLPDSDHATYSFAEPSPDRDDLFRCANCHDVHYDQWRDSAHARSDRSPLYRAWSRTAGPEACRPCHEPAAFHGPPGVRQPAGITCDFCHKIDGVRVDAAPRDRIELGRPDPADDSRPGPIKVVYGPLADAAYHYMGAAYSPLFERSIFCATCHEQATEQGVPIDTTFSDWQAWASTTDRPRTCQRCHMPAAEEDGHIARFQLQRPAAQFHDHSFSTARDVDDDPLPLEIEGRVDGDLLVVRARLENTAGHALPAGQAGRTLFLVVTAERADGRFLTLAEGPALDESAGGLLGPASVAERLLEGALAGLPGRAFVRSLVGVTADGPPHRQATGVASDRRIPAGDEVVLEVTFRGATGPGPIRVTAVLFDRPASWAAWQALPDRGEEPLDRIVVEKTKTFD